MKRRIKKRKPVTKRRKIARLMASVERHEVPLELMQELQGYYRPIKKPITLRVDADVLAWFKKKGRGYQTRINVALRKVMLQERKKSEE
ncbi:MAG: BrnA antitoxin family protein [Terriglobales bacterium]